MLESLMASSACAQALQVCLRDAAGSVLHTVFASWGWRYWWTPRKPGAPDATPEEALHIAALT